MALYFLSRQKVTPFCPMQELDLFDIFSFDHEFGKTLQEMQALVRRKRHLEAMGGCNQEVAANLDFRGASIEDLCLSFTLPGYPDYILKEGEENTQVFFLLRPQVAHLLHGHCLIFFCCIF